MGRKSKPTRRKPSFIKILCKDFSKKLKIPPQFVKRHPETLPQNCVLRSTTTHNSWRVSAKLIDEDLYFKKGWTVFVQDNSLKFGDCLVFQYAGDSQFYVEMYDMSCCYKDVRKITRKATCMPRQEDENMPQRPSVGIKKDPDAALEAGNEFQSSSNFPSFKVVMRPAYLRCCGYLYVPFQFAEKHLTNSSTAVKLQVSEKVWHANLYRAGNSSRLTSGWCACARENSLQAGDVCVFQLINKKDAALKVSIFRCSS